MQLEKNDRLMSVHTSSYSGDAWWKNYTFTCSSKEIAGLNKKKREKKKNIMMMMMMMTRNS